MADSGRLQGWRGLEPLLARQHSVSVGPCLGSLDHSVQIHIQEAAPFLKMSLEFCSSYGELPLDLMKSRCLSSCWPKVVAWEGWGGGTFSHGQRKFGTSLQELLAILFLKRSKEPRYGHPCPHQHPEWHFHLSPLKTETLQE